MKKADQASFFKKPDTAKQLKGDIRRSCSLSFLQWNTVSRLPRVQLYRGLPRYLLFLTYTLCALPTEMMEVFYNKYELVGKGVCKIIQVGRGIITGNPNEYGIR